ncbi:MAG: NAD(P)H-hydrate epimerase [Planctomycetes bacterium]|nr:NAD(P)H-hydrate epimerase [Planctomycetota bacterium]
MRPLPSSTPVLTRDQVRDVDRRAIEEFGMAGLVLMENAGRNAATLLQNLGAAGPILICCGKGNNAGDGFVVARHLENARLDVRVLLAVPSASLSGDAAANLRILQRAGTCLLEPPAGGLLPTWTQELSQADWIVDALLGTGAQGIVREPFVTAIDAINASGNRVFSLDLPSGMDCDSGLPLGTCVRAIHTATFVARKPGFDRPEAQAYTGTVHVMDIGVPRSLLREIASGEG